MCNDGGHDHDHAHSHDQERAADDRNRSRGSISRRRALQVLAGAGAAAAGARLGFEDFVGVADAASFDGTKPWSMAMHIHSSFSEGYGSMATHLDQAERNNVNVIWWTDHDFRMSATRFRKTVHFTSLTNEAGAPGEGGAWAWTKRTSGPLTADSNGGIVSTPASPNDTVANGSLWVRADSTSTSQAMLGFFADAHPAGWNYQTNLFGQVFTIDVRPKTIASDAYLEFSIASSWHPSTGGRPAGVYTINYRVGGPDAVGSRVANGTTGIVTLAAPVNQWTTLQFTPSDDIAVLWPDMQARDFSSNSFTLNAVSRGSAAEGYFDYLRFSRPFSTGDIPIQVQDTIRVDYMDRFPTVKQRRALEMGELLPHINWFGGDIALADYSSINSSNHLDFMRQRIHQAHHAGGLASYNHPFGYNSFAVLPQAQQDSLLESLATTLLGNNAINCDIIEVGYEQRNGIDLGHHVGLWDTLSRNAMFLTGNGVTDDHAGTNWTGIQNNWVTSVWAPDRTEAALLTSLRSGRAWTSSLSRYRGNLDLLADGVAAMGSASVSSVNSRALQVTATKIPTGGSVRVVRGVVDYAGSGAPRPNTAVVKSFAPSDFVSGKASMNVDTSSSCFVRTQVVNSAGAVVAVSNPVWLLRSTPPNGIPTARRVA